MTKSRLDVELNKRDGEAGGRRHDDDHSVSPDGQQDAGRSGVQQWGTQRAVGDPRPKDSDPKFSYSTNPST